ncbi:heterokaryon incompatibility protein-domain-containing protein [Bisporella sp. PMI_857]|nr:heterokaryon incompatibility protein-domain-containing protein [Bisporella sp. PMI_857]
MSDLSADGENQGMEGFYRGDDGQGFTEADGKVLMWPHEEAVSNMIQVPTGYFPRVQKRRGPFDLEDRWTYTVDNAFAYGFFKRLDLEGLYTHPQGPAVSRLCEWCSTNRIMATNFERIVRISDLKDNETNCELCGMIYRSTDLPLRSSQEVVRIYRKDSNLWMDGWSRPILRLCAGLKSPQSIGIGFPILADVGSELHFGLIREWLRACDKDHSDYGCRPRLNPRLPTRVLKVGDDSSPPSLYCSGPDERGKYLALSHCWGILPQDVKENACTYRRNFEARCREIDVSTLPKNFRDAVLVTRKLGIRFVWIDSLCIVQDDDQDWDRESKLMEEVYGSAYCTIAASSAKDSTEGFLCPRDSASFVRVPIPLRAPCSFVELLMTFTAM